MSATVTPMRTAPLAKLLLVMAGACLYLSFNKGSWPLAFLGFVLCAVLLLAYALPHLLLGALIGARPREQSAQRGDDVGFAVAAKSGGAWKSRFVLLRDQNPAAFPGEREAEVFVEEIGSAASTEVAYRRKMYCRGVFEIGPCEARCSFPFGLFEISREVADTHAEMVVLPRVWPVSRILLAGLSPYRRDTRRDKRGVDDEFVGVREYTHGDERRHVHWRTSARLGRLVIREFQTMAAGNLLVLVDFYQGHHCGAGVRSTFEYMMEIAASLGAAARAQGQEITFVGWLHGLWTCRIGRGALGVHPFLVALARAQAEGHMRPSDLLQRLHAQLRPQDRLLALLSDQNGDATAHALAACARAGVAVGCVVLEAATFDPKIARAQPWPAIPGVHTRLMRGDVELPPQLIRE